VLPLYSRLSQAEQAKRVPPSGRRRRIVLATNVAETSLTVPGIRYVIDPGLARISRYSHRNRLQRLPIEKISQASANQRAGRCGRVGPGVAIRLYSEEDYLARPAFTEPEIQRTNLAAVILTMAALRLGAIEEFPFVEPPDGRYVRDGQRTLREIGALTDDGQLTESGRKLARLPLDPRLGRILLAGAEERCLEEIAIIAAALSVPDPRDRPADKQTQADQKHAPLRDEKSDFLSLLKLWRAWQEQRAQLSRAKLRGWCKENFLSYLRLTEWQDVHGQVMEVVRGELALQVNAQPAEYQAIHRALLAGLLSQVAQRREQGEYLGANGTKLAIHPGSGQFKARPAWIVSAEQVQTSKVYARTVARIEPMWVEQVGAHLVRRQHYEPHWEQRAARAAVYERVTLFGLTLSSGRRVPYEQVDAAAARELFIRHALVRMEYDARAPWLAHNLQLLQDTEYLQQKGRRVDLLADEGRLYEFFDARVPEGISTGAAFERWRRDAERKDPKLLFLAPKDIAASEAEVEAERFPDHLPAGPLVVQLRYRFEPGHEDDGVSAIVPLHVLNQLPEEPFGWLVPGLLEEKVTALLRALPKALRVHFVPVPEAVKRVMPRLEPGRGALHEQLGRVLALDAGVPVPRDALRETPLPPHLRMNFLLVDDAGKVLARSRDLASLRAEHGGASQRHYAQASQITTGARGWVFGELAERIDAASGARRQTGYPALVDEGDSVGLRVFATPPEARASHVRGTARLVRLALARELKALRRDLPVNVQAELVYRGLAAHPLLNPELVYRGLIADPVFRARPRDPAASQVPNPERINRGVIAPLPHSGSGAGRDLRDDLLDRIVMTVFLDGREALRNAAAFEARVESLRGASACRRRRSRRFVQDFARAPRPRAGGMLRQALPDTVSRRHPCRSSPGSTPAGFLLIDATPNGCRSSRATCRRIEQRLDKLGRDAQLDPQLTAEMAPLEARWREQREGRARTCCHLGRGPSIRWLLEEFRVSLFAAGSSRRA
jgi:ATP-dependent helicase HrpA